MEGKRVIIWVAGIGAALLLVIVLQEQWGTLRVGSAAPDFAARINGGEIVRLADYVGRQNVVLFFYPKDFTTGCTSQACSFRDRFEELRGLNAALFGVSGDGEESHRRFAATYRLPFSLISDSDRSLARTYGVLRLGGLIPIPKRVTYVIDKKGIIQLAAHDELSMERHVKDVVAVLRRLQEE